jgi:RNA polymerase sigma factor (sigma-70 family)
MAQATHVMDGRFGMPRWWDWRHRLAQIASGAAGTPRAAQGDVVAFEGFVRQYERLILNYLWRMVGEEQAARDLTQETFLRAWEHFAKISGYENPRAWLLRVATNLALTFRTRRRAPVGAAVPLDDLNAPFASDPARGIVESEMVRLTLQALAPRERALLVLREVYGQSIDDIAGILGMTRDAVKTALCRARERFRTLYEQEELAQ